MLQPVTGAVIAAPKIAAAQSGEYLTFRLGAEEYGIDILRVQEIRRWEQPTPLGDEPRFIAGVINLRGAIVPVVDMRIRFGLGEAACDMFTVVVMLNLGGRIVGMVVDAVTDVITLQPEQIHPAPEFSAAFDLQYVSGLGTVDNRMLILVDIEKLMNSADMALTESVVH